MRLWCPTATRVYHDVTDLSLPFLNFLGVRYAITLRPAEPEPTSSSPNAHGRAGAFTSTDGA
jgi:hypothetical protein